MRNTILRGPTVTLLLALLLTTSCVFSPEEGDRPGGGTVGKWQDPITPGVVLENLKVAFSERDIVFYERCLHPDYYYESPSVVDSLNTESWPRSVDLEVMGNLFDDCTSFVFTPGTGSLVKEYGIDVAPDPLPQGSKISAEHPDQIWYIYNYYITMDMYFKTFGDFKVQQYMKFAMLEEPANHWSIIRWIDESNLSE